MFCSNCGNQLEGDVKFCPKCGTSVGNGATSPVSQPASADAVHSTTVMLKNCRCNHCGELFEIPKNARGVMTCPSCQTECALDGVVRNAEMAMKDGVSSGISLSASAATLHHIVVSVLSGSSNIPLDTFEQVEVIREEHYCVPAYLFHCNGTASFTYEVGVERQQKVVRTDGKYEWEEVRRHTEWQPQNSSAVISTLVPTPGNNEMVKPTEGLLREFNPKRLVDYSELVFPPDVKTYSFNILPAVAFDKNVVPAVDNLLHEQVGKLLAKQNTCNVSIGNSSIQKELTRIFMGIYRVVFKYGDKEYSVWVNGNGSRWYWNEGLPKDENRKNAHDEMKTTLAEMKTTLAEKKKIHNDMPTSNRGCLIFGIVLLAIPAMFFLIYGAYLVITKGSGHGAGEGLLIGIILFAVLILLFVKLPSVTKKGKEKNKAREDFLREINEYEAQLNAFENQQLKLFEGQLPDTIQRFKEQKKALRGIYEKVSGDESAF